MAKPEKKPKKQTPGSKAYQVLVDAARGLYDEYAAGEADDDDFPSPGKQKKVAKQLAKHHNRLLKKGKLDGIEIDEEELD